MRQMGRREGDEFLTSEQGSITVFMAFIFLLLSALLGVTLDSARFFGSRGYVKTSAYGADIALFGKYNRELFEKYGLLAYGGYDGKGPESWREDFYGLLSRNLSERPEQGEKADRLSGSYASVYRLGDVEAVLEDFVCLSEEEEFLRQIKVFLETKAVRSVSSKFLQGAVKDTSELQENLTQTIDILRDAQEEKSEETDGASRENTKRREDEENDGSEGEGKQAQKEESALGEEQASNGQAAGASLEKKENPLEFIRELVRDGVLSLVCDEKKLFDGGVDRREGSAEISGTSKGDADTAGSTGDERRDSTSAGSADWCGESSGIKILGKLLDQEEPLLQSASLQNQGKKGKLILYASQVFDCYIDDAKGSIPYGLEYLVSGEQNQKDAFAAVVNRLFLIRTLINYAYTGTSPVLQEESLATATAIAGPLAAGALIPVIQQGILMVLALEEACVDITALLDGKSVPVTKNQGNFKMQYKEICMANKKLFQRKAASLPVASKGLSAGSLVQGVSYWQYLYFLQLTEGWTKLYSRSLDLIQQDLRQSYNQTFTISQCISQTRVRIEYGMPLLTSSLLIRSPEQTVRNRERSGLIWQEMEVSYGY